jgi:hypothetical protein
VQILFVSIAEQRCAIGLASFSDGLRRVINCLWTSELCVYLKRQESYIRNHGVEKAYNLNRLRVFMFYSWYIGFEFFTAVVMKGIIFWDISPCSPLSFNRRFGGTYRLHLQGRRNTFSKGTGKQAGVTCLLLFFAELIYFTLKMEAICSSETSVKTERVLGMMRYGNYFPACTHT